MWRRFPRPRFGRLAVVSLAAITICLAVAATTPAFSGPDNKARSRAERALRDGDFAQAEQIYRELLSKDAHDNDARLGLSLALLKQQNLQDAYDHAARVIVVDPLSARAHALLGATLLAAGDFRQSGEEFRTATSLNENEAIAVAGLAMIDFYENRLEPAIRGLRRASELVPNEPDYVFNLGQAAARKERYREAADAFERFLNVAPKTDADRRARIRGLIDFLRYLGQLHSLYDIAGANRTIIPFEATDNRPILLVRVNGEKTPLRFVLDTGSGMSVISDTTAKRLGLRAIARGGMARAVGGAGRFEITSIDYGERTFLLERQHSSNTADLWSTVYRPDSEPVSGSGSTAPPNGAEIPLRTTSSGFLSGEVRLEGVDKFWNFIIDTGATVSVVSERMAAIDQINGYRLPTKMRVYGAAGITEDVNTLLLPRVMLGTLAQERVNAAVLDLDPVNETAGFRQSGILGGNFLKHFRVVFDFHRGVIQLVPLSKATESVVKPDQR